jgi:hypothetical protein
VAQKKAGILLKVEVVKVVIVLVVSLLRENEGAKGQENTCEKESSWRKVSQDE